MPQILVVDDEIGIRELLSEILSDEGYAVLLAENAVAARNVRRKCCPDLVLLDIWMPEMDGVSLLKEWSSAGLLTMPVVMMSGHGTIDTAVEATRIGAVGFLEKPIALQKLLTTVKTTLKNRPSAGKPTPLNDVFEELAFLKDFRKRFLQAAMKSRVLLIKHLSGFLVELCARTLQTARTPWLDILALDLPLTQTMLEETTGGILFVSDLSSLGKLQQKNLAFALDNRLERFRLKLIVACACPLSALESAGWSAALLSRLADTSVSFPSVSAHADEIPRIAAFLLACFVDRNEVPARRFAESALSALRLRRWEGEWLELITAVKSLALFSLEEEITSSDVMCVLEDEIAPPPPTVSLFRHPLRDAREAFECQYFEYHLKNEQGNMARIADKTGLERTHLYRKLKQLGLRYGRHSEDGEG